MCFSHIQVKLTHVIQKCSTGPQIIFFVKIFQVHSVNNMWSKGMLLCILIVYCNAVVNEETSRFLNENGFGNLEPTFLDEEIEVRQIPRMPDNLLDDLQVKLTHVFKYSQMFNMTSDYIFCEVFPSSLSQQYVVKGDATLHSHRLL